MRAVTIGGVGGAEVLAVREVPTPAPGAGQVRVRVRAAGVNRADLMQARGHYPAPPGSPADIPGLEFAGEVDALGTELTGTWELGDRVYGIVGGGGLAEAIVTHERMLAPIPPNLDFDAAAAVPEVFFTAFDALDAQAGLRPGETVLIHAVGGGVGSAAVQLAHAMGCTVLGTARTAEKLDRCKALGLDVGIDSSAEDFAEAALRATGGAGVDAVIDHLGASAWAGNVKALADRGRLVLVGLLGGHKADVNLAALLRKRLTVVATTLRARPIEEKIAVTQAFAARVNPWLARGLVRPVVERVYPLEEVRAAQEHLESNAGFGKIVLRMD
jgi:putative PIG3 family NAD(P)H quinone oxidoreductase